MNIPYLQIFLVLLVCWFFQLWLNSRQVQKFNKRFNQLRKLGTMSAIGMMGKYWQGRVFAILVSDDTGTITAAEYLSGVTTFSSSVPLNSLVGMNVKNITAESNPNTIKKKIWLAFVHAAGFIEKKILEDKQEEIHADETSSESVAVSSMKGGLISSAF